MAMTEDEKLCVNTIRTLSMDAVQAAESGHPGMPMGMADAAYVLWTKFLKHNPDNPEWQDRDRFVLSAGHGSMLLYSLLHLTGYDFPMEEIKNFRQLNSITPGHPEADHTIGIETTTGPLGQGMATGIGMALAEAYLAQRFNRKDLKPVDHYTYGIVSDGDLMEGISHEAASLAGHLQLGKVIYLYDSNSISIDGSTDLTFTDDTQKRFESYGWHVQKIDGHNHQEIEEAIINAQEEKRKPSLIECETVIGYGSPNKGGKETSHGAPLGEEEIELTKKKLGWPYSEPFMVPDEVYAMMNYEQKGGQLEYRWKSHFLEYSNKYPEKAEEYEQYINNSFEIDWESVLPEFPESKTGMATRKSSGEVIQHLAEVIPNFMGGSADLTGSNKTEIKQGKILTPRKFDGKNMHYGVREHAMTAILNGVYLHKGITAFAGTFLVFSDYSKPSIRIAALTGIPSVLVFTHDSIGLGEDGPTHQPIEHLAGLRATPNVTVIRPGDANEVSWAWKAAIENNAGPTLLVLTRQNVPTLDRSKLNEASGLQKGAYIIKEADSQSPDLILIATGSELSLVVEASEKLAEDHIKTQVVSMPSWELFEKQEQEYQDYVLPPNITNRISVEAASTFGWERWIGSNGLAIGVDTYGLSAPGEEVYKALNITTEHIISRAKKMLSIS